MAKTEFFPEENSLSIDEKYHSIDAEINPETKRLEIRSSAKEDVFYSTDIYEYKISTDPIGVEIRLVESMTEPPPDEYKVKDGVVLESEIRKNNKFLADKTIEDLKKQVEWNKIWSSAFGNSISFFIFSKHQEIISKEEYRKHLRQTSERIKNALQHMEDELEEKDSTGLKIQDSEWGKQIWYQNTDGLSEDELGRKREYANKIFRSFYKDENALYEGMSQSEFMESTEILETLDILLNQKEISSRNVGKENEVSWWVKAIGFVIQWAWLFFIVSLFLWLLTLVIKVIQYDATFAFVVSGVLTLVLRTLRKQGLS